jgi:hydroxymethylpyrimidine/phosphomethylpyrimidine kinase
MDDPFTVLLCGGLDPTGGAGLAGDLATCWAHGVRGAPVAAAVTAQNAWGVLEARPVASDLVGRQVEAVLAQVRPRAAKTGMLLAPEGVEAVARSLAGTGLPLVVDPVLRATAGGAPLAGQDLPTALVRHLFPLAAVVTPNLDEAAVWLGRRPAPAEAAEAAAALRARFGCGAVLLKGGHAEGPAAVDYLATAAGVEAFSLPRVDTRHGHGSGCALATALAIRLGRGAALGDAVAGAKAYLHRALAAAGPLGGGRGPVAHAVPAEGPPSPARSLVRPAG